MNTHKNLLISTSTITIKVIQVDGHKMTKSTFRQIPFKPLTDRTNSCYVLGWVSDDGPKLLWSDKGKIYRSDISHWVSKNENGEEIPLKDCYEQLFIAT